MIYYVLIVGVNVSSVVWSGLLTVSNECELLAAGRFMGRTPAEERIFLKSCKVVATTRKSPTRPRGVLFIFFTSNRLMIDERGLSEKGTEPEGASEREKETGLK